MGINYKSMEKKKRITLVEALELYVPGGWKFTRCHCKKNCSLSNTCKYKTLSKPCNTHCHGGRGGKKSGKISHLWNGDKKVLLHNEKKLNKKM
jgi:hypothetical protein